VFEARLFEPVLRHAMRADKRVQSHQTDMKDFKDLQGSSRYFNDTYLSMIWQL
jgi:hypothetical protein